MSLENKGFLRRLLANPETGILLALLGLSLFLFVMEPKFLSGTNLYLVSRQIAFTAIVALGVFFVILSSGIDLSVGSVAGLSGVACGMAMASGVAVPASVAIGLGAGALAGLVNGLLVARLGITPFIVTLGMLSMARGLVMVVTHGEAVREIPESFIAFGNSDLLGVPLVVWVLVAMALAAQVLLKYTVFGLRVMAIGGNEEASLLSGVPVKRVKIWTYTLSGACAAVSGVLFVARFRSAQSQSGFMLELDAIAACVIGGASLMGGQGTVLGVLIGATIMGVLHNGLVLLQVSAYWQELIIGAVIVLAAVVDRLRHRKR
ncbi:MAG: ABC transporter permease [candidate division FCPU426 bacterium]